jgi:hypothetical protein
MITLIVIHRLKNNRTIYKIPSYSNLALDYIAILPTFLLDKNLSYNLEILVNYDIHSKGVNLLERRSYQVNF